MNVKYFQANVDDRGYNVNIVVKYYILGWPFINNKKKCLNK